MIEKAGGIEIFIVKNDIVIIKSNAQFWDQGRTNLSSIKGFINLDLARPSFKGELIIAENNYLIDESLPEEEKDNVRGWTHFSEINGDINGVNYNLNILDL